MYLSQFTCLLKDLFALSAAPSSHFAVGDLPVDDSPLGNTKTEEDDVDPSDITTPCQVNTNEYISMLP